MRKTKLSLQLFIAILFFTPPSIIVADEGVGLIDLMGNFQIFAHKAGLSIRAGNPELADFYMHEIEENLEATGEIEEYDGYPVGDLSIAMLTPVVENVGSHLDSGDMEGAMDAYNQMINACNACHLATAHGFIKIVDRSTENPYMQAFE